MDEPLVWAAMKHRFTERYVETREWFEAGLERYENDPEYLLDEVLLQMNEEIVAAMERNGVSKAELARRLNRSKAFVTKLLNGQQNVTLRTLVLIAHALGERVELHLRKPQGQKVFHPASENAGRNGSPAHSTTHSTQRSGDPSA